jgi:hypothetical protein
MFHAALLLLMLSRSTISLKRNTSIFSHHDWLADYPIFWGSGHRSDGLRCRLMTLAVSKRLLENVRTGSDARRICGVAYALIAALSG